MVRVAIRFPSGCKRLQVQKCGDQDIRLRVSPKLLLDARAISIEGFAEGSNNGSCGVNIKSSKMSEGPIKL